MDITNFLETQKAEYFEALNLMQKKIGLQYETFVEPIEYKENISNSGNEDLDYYRYDLFPKTEEDCYTEIIVNVNPVVFDEVKIFKHKQLELFIESFVWNACQFRLGETDINPALLTPWFLKWININDDFMYKEFQNFIHGIVINKVDKEQSIVIDFGTAQPNAVIELLDLIYSLGVKRINVSSFYN